MMLCVWKSYLFFYLGRVPQRSGLRRCSFLVQWDSRWLYTSRPQHLQSGCPPYWDLRWREPGRHNLHTHRYIVHIIIWNTIVWLKTFVWMSSQVWTTTWKVWELNTAVEFEDLHTDQPPACRPRSWSCWRWFPGRGRRREPWLGWRLRSQTGRPWWWWDCWGHDGRSSGCWPCVRPPPAGWRRYLRGGRGREEVRRGRDTDSCLKRWGKARMKRVTECVFIRVCYRCGCWPSSSAGRARRGRMAPGCWRSAGSDPSRWCPERNLLQSPVWPESGAGCPLKHTKKTTHEGKTGHHRRIKSVKSTFWPISNFSCMCWYLSHRSNHSKM